MLFSMLVLAAATSTPYRACLDRAGGVTAAVAACQQAELGRQDARLNAAYAKALARLPASRRTTLRSDERRWIAERDQHCSAAAQADAGGTAAGLADQDCRVRETATRTGYLRGLR